MNENTAPRPSAALMAAQRNGRLAFFLCLATTLGMFIFTLATFNDLPDRFPVHFNGAGEPNRWTGKDWGSWLMLPLVGLGLWLLMMGSAKMVDWARKNPKYLSMPDKKRFLALPPERQAPVWQVTRNMMHWIALPTLWMMAYAQYATWQVARGAWARLEDWPIFVLLGLIGLVTGLSIVGLVRATRRAVDGK